MAELTIEVTPAIIADFRAFYPEFTDIAWTDSQVTRALYISRGELDACRWGEYKAWSFLQRGWFALTAHYLTWLKAQTDATTADGSASTPFAESSKTVRDESRSNYIPAAMANMTAWESALALTPYGVEYLHLRDRAGMGAVCV